MPSAKVTSKGQITIPVKVRRAMGIKPGTEVNFYADGKGGYSFSPQTKSIADMAGCLPKLGYTPTLAEMDEAIGRYLSELDEATKSNQAKTDDSVEAA